jgi:Ca2+/H+ antiporter, TMEM165/GDT1 family
MPSRSSTRTRKTAEQEEVMTWSTAAPAVSAVFLASVVEVVEAFTTVLAVATLRGCRPAAIGTTAALALLATIVLVLGPLLGQIPVASLQLAIGVLLLLFGMGWLRKASLRVAGVIPLHDEEAIYAAETARLGTPQHRARSSLQWIAGITALKAVLLEGLEVVFIVIAVGAGRGLLLPASLGALAACALVLVSGAVIHRPLSRVPENSLKFGHRGHVVVLRRVLGRVKGSGSHRPGRILFLAAGLVGSSLARRLIMEFA